MALAQVTGAGRVTGCWRCGPLRTSPKHVCIPSFGTVDTHEGRRTRSGRHGDLVHLVCGVTRALVNAADGIGVGGLGQAEDVAGLGVGPHMLEVDALLALDVQVRLARSGEVLGRDSSHAGVDVHELWHS